MGLFGKKKDEELPPPPSADMVIDAPPPEGAVTPLESAPETVDAEAGE